MAEPCAMPSFEPWETPVERLRPPVSFSLEPLRFLPLQATRTSLGSLDSRSSLPSSWTHSSSARSSCLPLRCFSVAGTGGRRRCLPSRPARPRQTGSPIPAGPPELRKPPAAVMLNYGGRDLLLSPLFGIFLPPRPACISLRAPSPLRGATRC